MYHLRNLYFLKSVFLKLSGYLCFLITETFYYVSKPLTSIYSDGPYQIFTSFYCRFLEKIKEERSRRCYSLSTESRQDKILEFDQVVNLDLFDEIRKILQFFFSTEYFVELQTAQYRVYGDFTAQASQSISKYSVVISAFIGCGQLYNDIARYRTMLDNEGIFLCVLCDWSCDVKINSFLQEITDSYLAKHLQLYGSCRIYLYFANRDKNSALNLLDNDERYHYSREPQKIYTLLSQNNFRNISISEESIALRFINIDEIISFYFFYYKYRVRSLTYGIESVYTSSCLIRTPANYLDCAVDDEVLKEVIREICLSDAYDLDSLSQFSCGVTVLLAS